MDNNRIDIYQNNPGKAVADFCLGFFGIWVFMFLFQFVFGYFGSFIFIRTVGYFYMFSTLLYLALGVGSIFIFRAIGRRYIGIGILVSFLIQILVFGACMVMFSGF